MSNVVREVISRGRVLFQTHDDECNIPEPAILIHVDSCGTIVLEQEDRHITVNRASAWELGKQLKIITGLAAIDALKEKK